MGIGQDAYGKQRRTYTYTGNFYTGFIMEEYKIRT